MSDEDTRSLAQWATEGLHTDADDDELSEIVDRLTLGRPVGLNRVPVAQATPIPGYSSGPIEASNLFFDMLPVMLATGVI